MKYIVLVYIIMIGITPIWVNAASPEFRQQIRAITQCNDSIDNDGDLLLDFASDPDCVSWEDNNEFTEIQLNPQPETKPSPQPSPNPNPESKPSQNPQPETLSTDYIDIINPIQYTIDNPSTQQSSISKQADTYDDRARLDGIFSVIMIGLLSLGLWFWDFFLNNISK
jgi:hypothetical protein